VLASLAQGKFSVFARLPIPLGGPNLGALGRSRTAVDVYTRWLTGLLNPHSMKIYVGVERLTPAHHQRLLETLSRHQVVFADHLPSDAARQQAVAEADIVFGNIALAWLQAAPGLRWLQLDSAGIGRYPEINDQRDQNPALLSNLSDFYGRAVAETILAGILAHYRGLGPLIRAQAERHWIKDELEERIGLVHGSRVLVLGWGAIGQGIAKLLRAFSCEVIGFARTAPSAALHTLDELDAALPSADIVITSLPQTSATTMLFDRSRLARCAPHALFVNAGRGSVVDEQALIEALDENRLGGAFLDVTQEEPLPTNHPLWNHPKVILSQHSGGRFPRETDGKVDAFLKNFARFEQGQPLVGAVDSAKGY